MPRPLAKSCHQTELSERSTAIPAPVAYAGLTGYPRLYYHVRYDQLGKATPVLGWPTDQATKPILVDDLAAAAASGSILIHSAGLIDECLSFVTTDTGAQQSQEGKHDDRVMAAGIAWQARKRAVSKGTSQRPAGW